MAAATAPHAPHKKGEDIKDRGKVQGPSDLREFQEDTRDKD
jgi:hypothetical protein